MMKRFLLFSFLALAAAPAWAAGGLERCKALYDEAAYGEEFEDYKMLLPGKEGWIFRTKSDFKTDFPLSEENKAWFLKFQEALKSQKINSVFAIIPTRGMAAATMLPDNDPLRQSYDSARARENYRAFLAGAQEAGIHFTGTPSLAAGPGYFNRTDHHWTTAGAREMAQAVAAYAQKENLDKGLKKEKFATVPGPETPFRTTFGRTIKKLCGIELETETDATAQTAPAGVSADDLFAERPFPGVILSGTSNSKREFDNNFDGFLKEFLSADVYNAAISGGGITDSLIAYFNSDLYRDHRPRLIVWEIPGYYRFDDSQMPALLQQLTPAVYGDCAKPLVETTAALTPEEKRPVLIDEKALKQAGLEGRDYYVRLAFDRPVKKHFTLSIDRAGKKSERIKFKRSKRYPYDGVFYYMPRDDEAAATAISLSVPEEMAGLKVAARLCPVPRKPLF